MNNIVFGQYYNSNSWLHRLDPRTKMIFMILLMSGLFVVDSIYSILGIFVLVLVIIMSSKVPLSKFLNSMKMVSFLLVFTVIFQVIFRKEGTIIKEFEFTLTVYNLIISVVLLAFYFVIGKFIKKFRLLQLVLVILISFGLQIYFIEGSQIVTYNFNLYREGIDDSIFIVMRIVTLLCISQLLTLTTKPTELNVGLERLLMPLKTIKVNVSTYTMMVSIALRCIPTLINEANKILKAQASRGVDFKESTLKEKINQIVSLIAPMFLISFRRALDLADAMEARGYDPDGERSSITELKFRFADVLIMIFGILLLISLIVLNIMFGI